MNGAKWTKDRAKVIVSKGDEQDMRLWRIFGYLHKACGSGDFLF